MHAHEPDPQRLRRQLRALPDPLPPASLEVRLRTSQARRSHVLRGCGMAIALCLVAMLAMPERGRPGGTDALPAPTVAHDTTRLQLQAIDRALQTAYARGASDAEVAPLWEARTQLMRRVSPSSDATGRNPS